MLFHMKDHKAAVLENDLNKLQKDGPAAWADLPEDELFTPAGFSEERTSRPRTSFTGAVRAMAILRGGLARPISTGPATKCPSHTWR